MIYSDRETDRSHLTSITVNTNHVKSQIAEEIFLTGFFVTFYPPDFTDFTASQAYGACFMPHKLVFYPIISDIQYLSRYSLNKHFLNNSYE